MGVKKAEKCYKGAGKVPQKSAVAAALSLGYHGAVFNLNNPLLVFDLEATVRQDDRGHSHHDEILELGAVLLNRQLETVAEFSSLVKVKTPLNAFIIQLTGITSADLEHQNPWSDVAHHFLDWASAHLSGKIKQARLCTWGSSFDITLLRRQFDELDLPFPFSGTVIDVKSLCFLRQSLAGERTDHLDMEHLAKTWGLPLPPLRHRALADAQLTAALLRKVWDDLQGCWIPCQDGKPWQHVRLVGLP